MTQQTEQLIGALFRVLADEGHQQAQELLLETYHSQASADRAELAENLSAELVTILHDQLETQEEVDVLTTAVEYLLHHFQAVIDAAPVAIIVVSADGAVEVWNDAAERIFGWHETDMLTDSYARLLPDSQGAGSSYLDRLQEGRQLTGIETRHRHKDGSLLDVRLWAAPLHQRDGGFDGATFIVSDITEQKQREQRLAVLNRILRHNIRNEITIVQGHLDMVAETLSDESMHVDVMSDRIANITELSETARYIEQSHYENDQQVTTLDLTSVLEDRIDRVRTGYPAVDVTAALPESATVRAHELLPYAIDNLLENAIEHNTSDTPTIEIDVARQSDSNPTYWELGLRDNGPGLPESEKEILTSETETPLVHSTGVGLWLSRWIIRNSGGALTVTTSPQDGTHVLIRLNAPR